MILKRRLLSGFVLGVDRWHLFMKLLIECLVTRSNNERISTKSFQDQVIRPFAPVTSNNQREIVGKIGIKTTLTGFNFAPFSPLFHS